MRLLLAYVITKALGATVTLDSNDVRHAFAGGGTGFWGPNQSASSADGSNPDGDAVIVTPSAGDALVFGGDVTHGGMLITAGRRSVLVASFSTRTPDSPPDRTYGLQPAPSEAAGSLRRNW